MFDVLGKNQHTSIAMPPCSADHKINKQYIIFENASRVRKLPTKDDGRPFRVVDF